MMNIADARNGAFHLLSDLHLHFGRRGAGLRNVDVNLRKRHIRIQIDRQANEGDGPEEKQHHEQDDRSDRVNELPKRKCSS